MLVPIPGWKALAIALAAVLGTVVTLAGIALVYWLGFGVNGGSMERCVVEEAGQVRAIEWRALGGRTGLCLYFTENGRLDVEQSGYFDRGTRKGNLVIQEQAIGCLDGSRRVGPWLFLTSADAAEAAIDPEKSGWYRNGQRLDWHALGESQQDDLFRTWARRE